MECFASTAQLLRPRKKAKLENLSSITLGYLASRDGSRKTKHWKRMKILFDSGCAATLVNHRLVKDLKQTRENKTKSIVYRQNKFEKFVFFPENHCLQTPKSQICG